MTNAENLQTELHDLSALLFEIGDGPFEEWSSQWMSRQSLLTRQSQLLHQLELREGTYELEVSLTGARVINSTIEASFVGRFLEELQATVSAVGQTIMFGSAGRTTGPFPVDVVNAATMRLVATRQGSFVLGLQGPIRDRQLSFGDQAADDLPVPVFDEAVSRVLDVIDAVEHEVAGERLPLSVGEMGGRRPVQNLLKLAHLLSSNATGAVAVDRSPYRAEPRESVLTSGGARRLQTILERTEQSTERVIIRGTLTGVRWKSGVFDLEPDDGSDLISGKVVSELRDTVRNHFDQPGRFELEKTTTRTEIHDQSTTTYRLIGVEDAEQSRMDLNST